MARIHITQFDGGITNDPRDPAVNKARMVTHFDVLTDKHRMIPHYSLLSGDSAAITNQIVNFAYDGTTIYGLGITSGTAAIFTRTNVTDATWTSVLQIAGSARTAADFPAFIYYKNQNKVYGVRGGRYVYSFDPTGPSANNADGDLTAYTTVSNFLVHSKDDVLYLGYDNKIASKNGSGSWNATALTLPKQFIVTSLEEYGGYLAIGCRPVTGGSSRVFLWDRDSSLSTVSESIDWGAGNLMMLAEVGGELVGVSFEGDTGSYNFGQTRVVIRRRVAAERSEIVEEFTGFSQAPAIASTLFKFKYRGRVLFPAVIPIGGTTASQSTGNMGIWAIAKTPSGLVITKEYSYANLATSGVTLYGIFQQGDILFSSYVSGSNPTQYMDRIDSNVTYTTTSIWESTINPGMRPEDKYLNKQLDSVAVTWDSLPSGGQVVLKYRVDSTAAFSSTIFTTTSGTVIYEQIKDQSGVNFSAGREFEFRIESTGGAVITGFVYNYHVLKTVIL